MTGTQHGGYGADDDLVDYILGITFEIWEQGGVDLIEQYYGPDTVVYGLDGITLGSKAMIDGTNAVLATFPDRMLLADDVIAEGDSHSGYSSHRVVSPMTNAGDSMFGPATGKALRIMNMADCVVEEGVITQEWLARDNLALVLQLGFDTNDCAALLKARQTPDLLRWFEDETNRLASASASPPGLVDARADTEEFSRQLLTALWQSGDSSMLEAAFAPYAVLHRSPIEIVSGRDSIIAYHAGLRDAFDVSATSVDHVMEQPAGNNATHVATRWALSGKHVGEFLGAKATGRPVYILGVTHRRIVDGRIAVEWTVFDSLGVLSQLI
jgi:predicted ester cyclase